MQPPYHRLEEFVPLTPNEKEVVRGWATSRRRVARNQPIRREGDPVAGVFFLMDGWVGSSILLHGGRRQIAKIHLPGDMLGFPSLALSTAGETLEAITDVLVCSIPNTALGKMFEQNPRLATALFLSTQKERVALMQELCWVGSTSALGRLAAFLLDLHDRLKAAGMTTDGSFPFPLTQQHIGDLLGLTAVHVNRTLRRLDDTGFVERSRGQVRIRNRDGLRDLAPNHTPEFTGHEAWQRLGSPSDTRQLS